MTQSTALKILQTGANVFLTGEPGSGKTHIVNQYVAWLRERGVEPAITAYRHCRDPHRRHDDPFLERDRCAEEPLALRSRYDCFEPACGETRQPRQRPHH